MPSTLHNSWECSNSTSQGLALEQFFVLREKASVFGPHRSHELILVTRFTSKAPAFKNRRLGHPKFNYKGRATRPMPTAGTIPTYPHFVQTSLTVRLRYKRG